MVSNPPYSKLCPGLESKDPEMAICRHEVEVDLDQVVQSCADLVKPKGSVYLIYKAPRLSEIFNALHRRDMAVKKLYLISPAPDIEVDDARAMIRIASDRPEAVPAFRAFALLMREYQAEYPEFIQVSGSDRVI